MQYISILWLLCNNAVRRSWDIDGWALAAFIAGIVLFTLLAASIWGWSKTAVVSLEIDKSGVHCRYCTVSHVDRDDLHYRSIQQVDECASEDPGTSFGSLYSFVFWLVRLIAFLQADGRYTKFSWYKLYRQFPVKQPVSVLVTALALASFIYLLFDINTRTVLLSLLHFVLVTVLAEYLSRFSETKAVEYEKSRKTGCDPRG